MRALASYSSFFSAINRLGGQVFSWLSLASKFYTHARLAHGYWRAHDWGLDDQGFLRLIHQARSWHLTLGLFRLLSRCAMVTLSLVAAENLFEIRSQHA